MTDYITERACKICELAGDEDGPSQDNIALYRIYAVLSFAKGQFVDAEDVHDAWAAWTAAFFPEHRSLVPFDELPTHVRELDDMYVAAIHAAAKEAVGDTDG